MAQHSNIVSLHLLGVQAPSHVPAVPLVVNQLVLAVDGHNTPDTPLSQLAATR